MILLLVPLQHGFQRRPSAAAEQAHHFAEDRSKSGAGNFDSEKSEQVTEEVGFTVES